VKHRGDANNVTGVIAGVLEQKEGNMNAAKYTEVFTL